MNDSAQNSSAPAEVRSGRNPWPFMIIGWFVLFISSALAFIAFAVKQPMELVRPDYYEHELRHQQQMERVSRTQAIRPLVRVAYDHDSRSIAVQLPGTHAGESTTGRIQLYRPSNAGLDRQLQLKVGQDGVQKIDARDMATGLWKVQVTWKVGAVEFFVDESVVL